VRYQCSLRYLDQLQAVVAMPQRRGLVSCRAQLWPGFKPRSVHEKVVVEEVVLRTGIFLGTSVSPVRFSLNQFFITILTFILPLPEGQAGKTWEPSNTTVLLIISDRQKSTFILLSFLTIREDYITRNLMTCTHHQILFG
jgi:hypothetical protein